MVKRDAIRPMEALLEYADEGELGLLGVGGRGQRRAFPLWLLIFRQIRRPPRGAGGTVWVGLSVCSASCREETVKGSERASGHRPVREQILLYPGVQELER